MKREGKKSSGWLYGLAIGLLIAVNAIPLAGEYFSIMPGFKSFFVDFHLTDNNGQGHAGFVGIGSIPLTDGEILQYAFETPDEKQVTDNKRRINRRAPDKLGFHWGDRGYLWSDYLKFFPARRTAVEGSRFGLEIEPWQMAEITGPGAPWDIKSPHISFLGKFPLYDVKFEDENFKFDLEYKARSKEWHLSNQGELLPAGDFGEGRMNELPCDVSGTITHKKSASTYNVSGWGFLEDANGTWNWFEWGGHHWFSSHYENGWAVSFWLAQEDWQWGSRPCPVELWVYDADRNQFYNAHNVEVLNMEWDREEINGMDYAKTYRVRAVTNAGVVDITARSITFKPILGGVKIVPWDVKMAYSEGSMEGTFTYLDGSSVTLAGGKGTMENFQKFIPNMIYITPWSLILLVLLIGGRRLRENKDNKPKVRRTIWSMIILILAVLLLTVIWM